MLTIFTRRADQTEIFRFFERFFRISPPQIPENITEPQNQPSKTMKSLSITNLINRSPLRSGVFLIALALIVVLTMGAPTANGAPGDLIAPQLSISQNPGGDIFQLPINPSFGTPSFYWDNANLPGHYWARIAFDQSGNLYASDVSSGEISTSFRQIGVP